jgi:hypothetical protein
MKVLEQKSKMTVSMGAIVGEVSARVHKFSRHRFEADNNQEF